MNAIGTLLRDPIYSALTRWRMAVKKKMDVAAEIGRNPVSKHQIQREYGELSRLTRDGTAEPASRDQIIRRERGQGSVHVPRSADHEQDWQPYLVDPYFARCDDHISRYYPAIRRVFYPFINVISLPSYLALCIIQTYYTIVPCTSSRCKAPIRAARLTFGPRNILC